jgi:VCBS repeat-containing protein
LTAAQLNTLVYTPVANANGSPLATFDFTVNDAGLGTVSAQMSINVTAVNDAPTTTPATLAAIAEDSGARTITQAELLANANDIEGDGLTATNLAISAGSGTLVDNGNGTWDYTPAADDDTAVSFSYTITDSTDTVAGSATLEITPVNDAPVASNTAINATEDIVYNNTLPAATDADGDNVTFALNSDAANGTVVVNSDGSFNYTPDLNINGLDSFTYTVNDGNGGSNTYTVSINVAAVNDAPTVTSSAVTEATENSAYHYSFSSSDVEGNALTIRALTLPSWLTLFDNGDGTATLTGTPTNAEVGNHSVVLEVSDGVLTNIQNFTLNVSETTIDSIDGFTWTDPGPDFGDPEPDENEDPLEQVPSDDDPAEDESGTPAEENLKPGDLGQADGSIVRMNDLETEEIIYLTDYIVTGSEERKNDRNDTFYNNDLEKEISSAKYLNLKEKVSERAAKNDELANVSLIDFENDDLDQIVSKQDYDQLREEIDETYRSEQQSKLMKVRVVTATMTAFTVGFVSYLLRAGSMFASLMSTLPLWRGFDPIAIFVGDKKKKKNQNDVPDTDKLEPETLFDGEAE